MNIVDKIFICEEPSYAYKEPEPFDNYKLEQLLNKYRELSAHNKMLMTALNDTVEKIHIQFKKKVNGGNHE